MNNGMIKKTKPTTTFVSAKTQVNEVFMVSIFAFIAGFSTLVYETVWLRPLQIILGSTIYSSSLLLASFLAGFSMGSLFFCKKAENQKNSLRTFAFLEVMIGIAGIAIIIFLNNFPSLLQMKALKFVLMFFVFLVPSSMIGMTWPLINKIYVKGGGGKESGMIFFSNSLGASFGAIMAGFILVPFLGLSNTSIIASMANFAIAIVAFIISRRER
ncbi:MAG: fused MFS/spermidine synthase [archaeon]